MINFWIICGLLTFIACMFVFIPMLRIVKQAGKAVDLNGHSLNSRENENVSIFKERLAELDLEKIVIEKVSAFSSDKLENILYQIITILFLLLIQ